MFTLTNPWLLWAFPILVLPWIFRRRQEDRIKHLKFPLLQFLKESEQKERVNPLLQEWLLLLIRTILLALLLLALAGPKWISPQGVTSRFFSFLPIGQSFNANVVVIDESYSMGYDDEQNSWWQTAADTAFQLDDELQGVSTQFVQWSREKLENSPSERLFPMTNQELRQLFNSQPTNTGTSILDLVSAIENSFEGNESFILITDGQAQVWETLLEGHTENIPQMLVVDVGNDPVENAWVEINNLSSPPWGIAAWETIAGNVYYLGPETEDANITIVREKTGETVYSKAINFPKSTESPAPLPFVFSAQYEDLTANRSQQEQNSLSFLLSLQPNDALPIDDEVLLEVPIIETFPVAIAGFSQAPNIVYKVLASAFTMTSADDQPNSNVQSWGPEQESLADVELLLLPKNRVPYWNLEYSSNALEYVKTGGSMIVFTGQQSDGEWNRFLTELGWEWLETDIPAGVSESDAEPASAIENLTVWGDGLLGQALDAWPENAWEEWISNQHGTLPGRVAEPLVAYEVDNQVYDLVVGRQMGEGYVWIVNTALNETSSTLLSPILPAFLWETAKSVARNQDLEISLPEPRPESNLVRLSADEKRLITENYNISFTTPENLSEDIDELYGGTDLRMILLLMTMALALFESWLSNKMASL